MSCPIPTVSPEKKDTNNTIQTEKGTFRNICVYMYTYMYLITINGKGGSNLKKSKEKCRKVWMEETEGENDMIIL